MSSPFKQLDMVTNVFGASTTIDLIALILAGNAQLATVPSGQGTIFIVMENVGTATAFINSPGETDVETPIKAVAGDTLEAGPYPWDVDNPHKIYGLNGASIKVSAVYRQGR